jgi:hypothetical protein
LSTAFYRRGGNTQEGRRNGPSPTKHTGGEEEGALRRNTQEGRRKGLSDKHTGGQEEAFAMVAGFVYRRICDAATTD